MRTILYKLSTVLIVAFLISSAYAQEDFQAKYDLGKEMYKRGKYAPAMEAFKPLTSEQEGNKFVRHAQYYYSLSAFRAGMFTDANNMLLQLTYNYPDWDQIDEAYYLLANVSFEQKKYRPALRYLDGRKKDMNSDIEQMKLKYLDLVTPIDTLVAIQKDYPADPVIAKVLFKKLSFLQTPNDKQKMLMDYLAQEYKFEKKNISSFEKASVVKPSYNVAVLFPFLLKELNTSSTSRPNQYVYDTYEGIKLAVDSLKRNNVVINLHAYDTEKAEAKVTEILSYPEMKTMDLIIGPGLPAHYNLVNEFALKNNIWVVNPFSGNAGLTEGNPLVYLFQPSLNNLVEEAASYADSSFVKEPKLNNVIIFQSPTLKDSLLCNGYKDSIIAKGFNVKYHESINKENIKRIQEILNDSLMLTTVSHIFVSTNDQVLAANIVSAMEISGFKIPMFAGGEWLQFPLLTYDQYERRSVHFLYPDYIDYNRHQVYDFRRNYFAKMNSIPLTSHAYQGFDLMLLFGKAMGKYGNFPIVGMRKEGFVPGYVITGFNYSNSQCNGYVPIVKFSESTLKLVNYPKSK